MVTAINDWGGVFGADLELYFADTQGSAEGAERAYARAIREVGEDALFLICDPVSETALAAVLAEDEVSAFGPGVYASEEDGYLFGLDATPTQHLAFFLNDLSTHWFERKPSGAGDVINVAVLSWPDELTGTLDLAELESYAESLGIEIVLHTQIEAEEEANVFDFIYEARNRHANVIFTNTRSFNLAGLVNGLHALGLRDRFVLAVPAASYDPQLYEYLEDPAFAEHIYLSSAWQAEPTEASYLFSFGDVLQGQDWGNLQMASAVDLARQIYEAAILDVGYEGLDAEAIFEAVAGMRNAAVLGDLYAVNWRNGARSLNQLSLWQTGMAYGDLILIEDFLPVPVLP
jgi:ABC-type branched-subunit amino acid transport system substrate-binding protein